MSSKQTHSPTCFPPAFIRQYEGARRVCTLKESSLSLERASDIKCWSQIACYLANCAASVNGLKPGGLESNGLLNSGEIDKSYCV
jgi:hypothetical protein